MRVAVAQLPPGSKRTAPLGCYKCAIGRFLQAAGVRTDSAGMDRLPFVPASNCSNIDYSASLNAP